MDMASGMDDNAVMVGGSKGSKGDEKKKKPVAVEATRKILEDAISSTVDVGGRDVELLQRVVAKEGEARVALLGVLWTNTNSGGERGAPESQFGTACARLNELNADYWNREADRIKRGRAPPVAPRGASLGYSIDDIVGAEEAGCSRFKNEKFVEEKLVWSDGLRTLVRKFLTLSR